MSNNKWTPWKVKGHPPSFRSATRSKWCGNMVVEDLETIKSQSGRFSYSGQNWYICLLFFMSAILYLVLLFVSLCASASHSISQWSFRNERLKKKERVCTHSGLDSTLEPRGLLTYERAWGKEAKRQRTSGCTDTIGSSLWGFRVKIHLRNLNNDFD